MAKEAQESKQDTDWFHNLMEEAKADLEIKEGLVAFAQKNGASGWHGND